MIGAKVMGSGVVGGELGIISSADTLVEFVQDVRFREVEPAGTLITFEQSVGEISPADTLVRFQQRVFTAGEAVSPPAAYIYINEVDYSSSTDYDAVQVSFNEGQSATASIFVHWPLEAVINIPAFHGKPIRIETHIDPDDAGSELITLFIGWIETAKHNRTRRGIEFTCTDLRDERLGREDGQQIKATTGGLYSNVTQKEDAKGREYVAELMKTVSGDLGYTRSGQLSFHTWGVSGKPVDLVLTDTDVDYADITTEFQTRSSIVNSVTINVDYRYSLLRTFSTTVDAYKKRNLDTETQAGVAFRDYKAFRRDLIIESAQGFDPWQTVKFKLYPLERAYSGKPLANQIFVDGLYAFPDVWCQGFKAELARPVAQAVTEAYSITITAPQSVDAYGETIEGSTQKYAVDTEYDRSLWETDFSYKSADRGVLFDSASSEATGWLASADGAAQGDLPLSDRIAAAQSAADDKRTELAGVFNAGYAIGKKEIISSHRQNYISALLHRIQPVDIGQVLQHNNRIVQAKGQVTGLEYRIANGARETDIRIALSYMDSAMAAPDEDWAAPSAPASPASSLELESTAEYTQEKKAFEITVAEIPASYTDELTPVVPECEYTLPLEINDITLVNGY